MKEENNRLNTEDDTIDVFKLLKDVYNERKFILRTTLIFALIGLFIVVFSKNKYTSSTTFMPLVQGESTKSNLGGLASLAGINLGSMGNDSEISPDLYPQIVNSIPFQKELLQTPLLIKGQDTLVTYKWYYENIYSPGLLGYLKKYTLGLPKVIISSFKNNSKGDNILASNKNSIFFVSKEENELIEQLEEQINLDVNSKEGYVTISATMPEAYASSQLTLRAQELLQQYALNFKTQKSIDQLEYIEARFLEKQNEFNEVKLNLARFQDQNNSINTALGKTKLLQLQSDYNIVFNVYSELAKQLETQRLQVKKDTPLFTVLKPVTIPLVKSAPKGLITLFGATLLGFFISIGFVKAKQFYSGFKKEINSTI